MKLLKLVPDNTNIDFMRWRNWALMLSLVVTIGSIVLIGVRGLNLGIDFVGGQQLRVNFAQPVEHRTAPRAGRYIGSWRRNDPGIRRRQGLCHPPPQAGWARSRGQCRCDQNPRLPADRLSGRRGQRRRIGVGQGFPRARQGWRAGDPVRDDRDRRLYLDTLRMAVRRRRSRDSVPRRRDDSAVSSR